jgi:RNA polymerase sigma-70 factor (ECF subfamily)
MAEGLQVDALLRPDASDQELIQRVQAHDAEAFEMLFRRYFPRVSRQVVQLLGNPTETEEVVQEVFLALYEKAQTFRGEAAFSTWLYRLTTNAALTRLRRRQRHREVVMAEYLPQFREDGHHLVRPVVDWSSTVETQLSNAQLCQLLQEAIAELAPLDKAVVVLSDMEEMSNKEIADTLELTVPAVKARLHRSRLFLRGRLAAVLGHPST